MNSFSAIDRALRAVDLTMSKLYGSDIEEDINKYCVSIGYPARFDRQKEMIIFAFTPEKSPEWQKSEVKRNDPYTPRMLLGARGVGKTDSVTIIGLADYIEKNPTKKILIVTKERDRGKEIVAEIREILEARGVKIANRAKASIRLKACKGKEHSITCLTIRSRGIRGRHPDLIIMEDPITPDDDSPAERKRVYRTYEELLKLTKNILIIGQPVHKLDLYTKLRWQIPTMLVKWGEIPELDHDLDALRAAGATEASIQSSYFLELVDDESLPLAKIKQVSFRAKRNYLFIDPSHKGGDYTAVAIGGHHLTDFPIAGFCFKKAWYDCLDEIDFLYQYFNCEASGVETNGLGDLPLKELNELGLGASGINSIEPKHQRILNMATFQDIIKLHKVNEDIPAKYRQANDIFIEQVLTYEHKAEYDDAPDSITGLLKILGILEYARI